MVEDRQAVGAEVHLAELAETSALRGPKTRAKTAPQGARRLRELLQAGRVPESWIPPEHILELRSKVRLRHMLIEQRGEWQQRIQAQLYHHGVPRRRQLLVGRAARLARVPEVARRHPPADPGRASDDRCHRRSAWPARWGAARAGARSTRLLGAYAPLRHRRDHLARDPGGARRLPTFLLLAPRGPLRRHGHHRLGVRPQARSRSALQQGPPTLRWALFEAAQVARRPVHPTVTTTSRLLTGSVATAPACPSRAGC
jgi:hypothetical protein